MFLFHQWIKNEPVDLMMGNTYLKYIARDEDIPLSGSGFPSWIESVTAIFRPLATGVVCVCWKKYLSASGSTGQGRTRRKSSNW